MQLRIFLMALSFVTYTFEKWEEKNLQDDQNVSLSCLSLLETDC